MEYSIQQLARLTGLTARTLRWYDQIGLLRPARVAESGYRYYGPAQVDRLQDILYYRALGVELGRIRELLDDPAFDRLDALRRHLETLRAQQARLDALIRSVEKTIGCEERRESMHDAEKFEALKRQAVAENEAAYGQEARAAYGDSAVDAANRCILGMDKTAHDAWNEQDARLRAGLEAAVQAGLSPESETGRELCALHRQWLAATTPHLTPAMHRGIAELYVQDGRFTAYYDRTVPGCARFLRDAVARWAQ